jgi:ABC-type glycerol-3-phosphate transport system permease component
VRGEHAVTGAARQKLLRIPGRVFVYVWCGFSLFSLAWILLASLKTNQEFFSTVWGFFERPKFGNYLKVLTTYNMGRYFLNSMIVVTISVAVTVAVSALAAYVLARVEFRFSRTLARFFVFGLGIPVQLILIPLYFLLLDLKLVDRLTGLILVYIALSLPFTIFLMMGFFRSLPHELEEAALIDGCTPVRTFLLIMLPVGQPAIITSVIFNFVDSWKEFILVLTLITDRSKATLALGLYKIMEGMTYTGDWVSLFAGFVLVIVPSFVVYLFFSRRIVEGLTMGALKG